MSRYKALTGIKMKDKRSRILALLLIWLSIISTTSAKQGEAPGSWSWANKTLDSVPIYHLPAIDSANLLARTQQQKGSGPLQFAIPHAVSIMPYNSGQWTELANGSRIWRLRFHAGGATDFNFGFNRYVLPENAKLHIYSEEEPYYQGPYTHLDNKIHGQFWTPLVPGAKAVLELFLPATVTQPITLEITTIGTRLQRLIWILRWSAFGKTRRV